MLVAFLAPTAPDESIISMAAAARPGGYKERFMGNLPKYLRDHSGRFQYSSILIFYVNKKRALCIMGKKPEN